MIVKKCIRCKKKIGQDVGLTEKMFYCRACGVMVANPYYNMKGGNNRMPEEKVQAVEKDKQKAKPVKKEKVPKFDKDVEDKIIKLAKEGKSLKEIVTANNGHPAMPKTKRILKAANVEIKAKKK